MTDLQARPNVLLITVDQWAGRMLGCAGHSAVQTQTLDALAQHGTRFTRAYSECPICIPARRTLMTGMTPRSHGDRTFQQSLEMPGAPTLAGCFRAAGYQTHGVGKFHVYPPRDRIGFDDIKLAEEGRPKFGAVDDYEMFLGDRGHAGRQYSHGMSNNEYIYRPWHLDESCHVTNWIAEEGARAIKRRDPKRPAFWNVSFTAPHPPLVPLAAYLEMYRHIQIDAAKQGEWGQEDETTPLAVASVRQFFRQLSASQIEHVKQAFYALITQIDHQIRILIGTLREEGLLDDTIVVFTADHGDMLGDFGLWGKRLFYEGSANIPMIVMGRAGCDRVAKDHIDGRLVGLQDVMPTLLGLTDLPVPETVDGRSMISGARRETLYGECLENVEATRMIHDGRHKLIWYPFGNSFQLFDLEEDPDERVDLSRSDAHQDIMGTLKNALHAELYGADLDWVDGENLAGTERVALTRVDNRGLSGQRGIHFPQPPVDRPEEIRMPWEQK